jgi:L-ribulose-5-phosphate 3-epimerase
MVTRNYTLGLYEKAVPSELQWQQKLLAAKEAGYDFVEMSIDETPDRLSRLDWTKEERMQFVQMETEIGIPVRSMCLSGHRKYPLGSHDPVIRAQSLEIMRKAIVLACDLGIRVIMLAGYDVYYEQSDESTRKYFAENLIRCVDLAAKEGVTLAFETMETSFMNTVQKAMGVVCQVGSAWLQVYPDIGNINNAALLAGKNVLDDLALADGHIVGLHLKETVPGKFRNLMFGEGDVDFRQAVDKAWNIGVRRYVTEFWYLGNQAWKEDVCFACNFARRLLDGKHDDCCAVC